MTDWYTCDHEWVEYLDSMSENDRYCKICGCPGSYSPRSNTVYWPAT